MIWSLPLVGAKDALILPRLGGPSFTAVEQRTENARQLVEVHFSILSQVFVFPGSLGQFGHGTGGFDDSSGNL